jgi:hypothetical protein
VTSSPTPENRSPPKSVVQGSPRSNYSTFFPHLSFALKSTVFVCPDSRYAGTRCHHHGDARNAATGGAPWGLTGPWPAHDL